MKSLTLAALLFSAALSAQFNQTWLAERDFSFGFNDSYMRIVNNNLLIHPTIFEGSSVQSAQSITLDGTENWYMEHSQFDACANCGLASVDAVAISSTGDFYGVGFQPSSPYGGRYIFKTTSNGALDYAEEYFTSSFSGEFNDVKLSANETVLYVFGDMYSSVYNTIAPHLYKIDPQTGAITDEALAAPYAWVFPKKMALDGSDNIYINASNVDTLRFSSFNSNLEFRWTDFIAVPGYLGSGEVATNVYSNGDVLFSTVMQNYNDNTDQRLSLVRYSADGTQLWQQLINMNDYGSANRLYRDLVMADDGSVYFYFVRAVGQGGGGGMPEQEIINDVRGGKGGPVSRRPEVFAFDATGQFKYHFVYQGMSEEVYTEYPNRIIVDENGYLIGSSDGDAPYSGVSLFLVTPQGTLNSELRLELNEGATINGMLYAGNNVFYTHGIGADPEQSEGTKWMTARYTYDYVTGIHAVKESALALFPNPALAGQSITVNGLDTAAPLQVFSADGRLVWQAGKLNAESQMLNTSTLGSGLYLLKNGHQQLRFLVNK